MDTEDEVKINVKGQIISFSKNINKMNEDEKMVLLKYLKPLIWWGE